MSDWRRPLINLCKCGCGMRVAKNFKKGHGRRRPVLDRLMAKVDKREGGCWVWTGAVSTGGYGRIGVGTKVAQAHRVAYVLLVGPIPLDLHIDHLCSNRLCVNPDHLEAVTQAENNRRSWARKKAEAKEPA